MNRWRFESIDLRAGLAIAVRRPPRTSATELVCGEYPCLYFAPPYFQPEAIGNLAIAIAASRGSFAAGLYINDTEVSFATPEEVAEFVRRAYVGGAGGDGGDGGGGGPVPVPPEAPHNPEPFRPENFEPPRHMVKAIYHFSDAVAETKDGESSTLTWQELLDDSSSEATGLMALGLLEIYREMLRRMPSGQPDALRWIDDVRALSQAAMRMHLLPVLLSAPYFAHFRTILDASELYPEGRNQPNMRFLAMVDLFFGADHTSDESLRLNYYRWWRHRFREMHEWGIAVYASPPAWDILDVLERLPLSEYMQAIFPADLGSTASVYHLLNVFISNPQALMAPGMETAVLGMSLFAAACICSASAPVMQDVALQLRSIYSTYPDDPAPLGQGSRVRAEKVAEKALGWLAEHLPQMVYSPRYEALIAQAKLKRYRDVA